MGRRIGNVAEFARPAGHSLGPRRVFRASAPTGPHNLAQGVSPGLRRRIHNRANSQGSRPGLSYAAPLGLRSAPARGRLRSCSWLERGERDWWWARTDLTASLPRLDDRDRTAQPRIDY